MDSTALGRSHFSSRFKLPFGAIFSFVRSLCIGKVSSLYSVVGLVISYGLDCPGNPGWGYRFSSCRKNSDRLWGPPSLLFSLYRSLFPGIKRPGLDIDLSLPSTVEVKNEWSYTSPPLRPHSLDGVYFAFTFIDRDLSINLSHIRECLKM